MLVRAQWVSITFLYLSLVCIDFILAKAKDFQTTTIALMIGSGSAVALAFFSLIAFIVYRRMHPLAPSTADMDKSYNRGSRRSSTQDELYHNNSKKPPDSLMEIPFTSTGDYDEDGDPDLIPSKNGMY